MIEIKRNIEVCTYIIAKLGQNKPVNILLNFCQLECLFQVATSTDLSNEISDFTDNLVMALNELLNQKKHAVLTITEFNLYHYDFMLSNYIAKHDLPESVVQSMGEVS